ncbi:hypothetical protein [Clostridium ganghwense]|uniref:Uncharacterized protein n=1 Tax=Clostridium ganghwense TaxID=312089 RepID=A0ABT4CJU8_9CLOT|nr:hypothetical protein [Clostridium ganghwense]MCY6369327.1 hypothetical protein [Clostridium ganghwense]
MKGYLLLQDGSLFNGKVIGEEKNILGEILLNDEGSITLQCETTGKQELIVNSSKHMKGHVALSDVDFESLKLKMKKNKTILGKIVTDSLPIEYHVYDLKTLVTLGLK